MIISHAGRSSLFIPLLSSPFALDRTATARYRCVSHTWAQKEKRKSPNWQVFLMETSLSLLLYYFVVQYLVGVEWEKEGEVGTGDDGKFQFKVPLFPSFPYHFPRGKR